MAQRMHNTLVERINEFKLGGGGGGDDRGVVVRSIIKAISDVHVIRLPSPIIHASFYDFPNLKRTRGSLCLPPSLCICVPSY